MILPEFGLRALRPDSTTSPGKGTRQMNDVTGGPKLAGVWASEGAADHAHRASGAQPATMDGIQTACAGCA
jgi:hypothetical protein